MPWCGEPVVIPYPQDWAQCPAQRTHSTLVGWIRNKTRGFKRVNKGLGRGRERQLSVWTKRHEFTVFWYLIVPAKMFPHGRGQGCIMAAQGWGQRGAPLAGASRLPSEALARTVPSRFLASCSHYMPGHSITAHPSPSHTCTSLFRNRPVRRTGPGRWHSSWGHWVLSVCCVLWSCMYKFTFCKALSLCHIWHLIWSSLGTNCLRLADVEKNRAI